MHPTRQEHKAVPSMPMVRRWLRLLVPGGLLLAVVLLARRTAKLRDEMTQLAVSPDPWTPIAEPGAPEPPPIWRAPVDGTCPPTHPIKAKSASGIYHLPGTANYDRTQPDRCYADEPSAAADGFTRAKR